MSASVKTAWSSLRFPRPAPLPPGSASSLSLPKNHKRMRSESNLPPKGVSRDNGELRYDHFDFLRTRGVVVKQGYVGLQRDQLRSWTFTRKSFVVLEERVLASYAKEDGDALSRLSLDDVVRMERVDGRRFCFGVWTPSEVWYLLFKDILSLEEWFRLIRLRCPLLHISHPTNFNHDLHVTYDPVAGEITGLPEPWIAQLQSWGIQSPSESEGQSTASPTLPSPMSEPGPSTSQTPELTRSLRSEESQSVPTPTNYSTGPMSVSSSGGHRRSSSDGRSPTSLRAPSIGASTTHFRKSPGVFRDVDARNLTGTVQPTHLLPTTRDENCDIWKADWTGSFGTRKVAIQVVRLPPLGVARDRQERLSQMILEEVKALHQLRHPGVVRIRGYAYSEQGPLPAIIYTWVPGGNLIDYLEYTRPIVGKIARLRFLMQAAAGLNYLHSFGREIIHGNFRGIHIMLDDQGKACVTGFGINPILAEIADQPDESFAPSEELSPAPRWAAPEALFNGRRRMSPLSDVFSFARTVLEVMTGRHPFEYITDDAEVIPFVLGSKIPRRTPVFGNDGLWQFLERCWQEDPLKRPTMALVLMRMEEAVSLCEATGDNNSQIPVPKSLSGR